MTTALKTIVSSATQTLEISRDLPTVIIGERINPTGRKKVLAALQEGRAHPAPRAILVLLPFGRGGPAGMGELA